MDQLEVNGLDTDGLAHLMITVGREKGEQVRTILGHRLLLFPNKYFHTVSKKRNTM